MHRPRVPSKGRQDPVVRQPFILPIAKKMQSPGFEHFFLPLIGIQERCKASGTPITGGSSYYIFHVSFIYCFCFDQFYMVCQNA